MSTVDVSMSGIEVSDLVALIAEEEPLTLRVELRDKAGESPTAGKAASVDAVTEMLWAGWKGELGPRGFDLATFRSVVEGADYEVWLWVMGDRSYDQLVAALAGRALRRSRADAPGA